MTLQNPGIRASVVRMLALFVAFALLSLSFWAYFNFRRPRTAAHDGPA